MSHTNYNAVSNKKVDETVGLATTVVNVEPETTSAEEFVYGTVVNCERLNVRESPDFTAPILCTIDEGTKVLLNTEESTVEWYKVDVGGQSGFCMKTYMTIDR